MGKRGRGRPSKVSSIFNQDPEFFEIFLPNRISHQLRIPPDFIKHFDKKIPGAVILKDLAGRIWHVDIKQTETGVFLKNGWMRFVNEKRLELGQVMVFRYDTSSTSFTVRIFGRNAIKDEDQDSKKPFNSVKKEQESVADPIPIRKSKRNRRKPQKYA
ncbi:putative B3 domain-containing protein At5g66980 [Cynara cardunculus var. scolymus]|uniref:AT hook, DNA-binding motif-containing protein n=1 Tax=Cynara cardunculus var. scolymus TaxID=59895 RepID=A0A124SFA9_CYNCS|nr:putative B3 domain-containing protein At5g66980 [Cynara cardunculus var. scolymus]KVI02638.1 AT hook, DNA-binding motif-containing protein [Cynara cardunculus var. scolymus]